MNPQDPLAALHPLREPGFIGWWPLAPGWWVLIVMVLLCVTALAYFYYRRYRADAYRRQATQQLQRLHDGWRHNEDSLAYLGAINALLKSVALRAFPRRDVAACNGDDWVAFLNQSLPQQAGTPCFSEEFASAAYRAELPTIDCEAMNQSAMRWIKQHRVAR